MTSALLNAVERFQSSAQEVDIHIVFEHADLSLLPDTFSSLNYSLLFLSTFAQLPRQLIPFSLDIKMLRFLKFLELALVFLLYPLFRQKHSYSHKYVSSLDLFSEKQTPMLVSWMSQWPSRVKLANIPFPRPQTWP